MIYNVMKIEFSSDKHLNANMNKITAIFSSFLMLIIFVIVLKTSSLSLSFKSLRAHYYFKNPGIFTR